MANTNVFVQNEQSGPVVFTYGESRNDVIDWDPKGDPNGGDIQSVDEQTFNSPQFQRVIKRGVLSVVDDESVVASSEERQRAHWESRNATRASSVDAAIERTSSDRDVVTETCIAPNTRGTGKCGEIVSIPEQKKGKVPPLCPQHEGLAPEFVPAPEMDGSSQTQGWIHTSMGEREYAN